MYHKSDGHTDCSVQHIFTCITKLYTHKTYLHLPLHLYTQQCSGGTKGGIMVNKPMAHPLHVQQTEEHEEQDQT